MARMIFVFLVAGMTISLKSPSQLSLKRFPDTVNKKISLSPLPQNFYNQGLGYFCKKELEFQKLIPFPIFIRLGSKDHVDYLEQKPNSRKKD
jgi:hypothetical protein